MQAETLRGELVQGALALAWEQWAELGLSGWQSRAREERAADPEALMLFTLEVGREDPRLFDELMDWLALNDELISVHRLRRLCRDDQDRALVEAALAWSAAARGRARAATSNRSDRDLRPLFPNLAAPGRVLDPWFAEHGWARAPLARSHKSQPPRLLVPVAFAFRLRRLMGIGVRAEVVRSLLTIRAPRLSGRLITLEAAFAQRNVREGLTQLVDSGVIDVAVVADDRTYAIDHQAWALLLRLPAAPALPFHFNWIPTLSCLTGMIRWLSQPGLDQQPALLRASDARQLVLKLEPDLRAAGVPLNLFQSLGQDYWGDFVSIAHMVLRLARGHVGTRPGADDESKSRSLDAS